MYFGRLLVAGITIGLAFSSEAGAHTKPRAAKEIVRISGTLVTTETECRERLISLRVLDETVSVCGESRRIAVVTAEIAERQDEPLRFDLQADQAMLAPLLSAAVGHRATILGEWRPGRRDLFLIALDVCPCDTESPQP